MNQTKFENSEFEEIIKDAVSKKLGENYEVEIQKVVKNNSVSLSGLVIREKDSNISPTFYFEEMYQEWVRCGTDYIVEKILNSYRKCQVPKDIDFDVYQDFSNVKNKICYKLISMDKNEALLEEIPYIPYLNLAICFYCILEGEFTGMGTVLIYNRHMEMWNTSVSELYELARENTQRLLPFYFCSMKDILQKVLAGLEVETPNRYEDELSMYVLTNEQKHLGAIALLYDNVLELIYQTFQSNFYILPSSVHEVIVLPENSEISRYFLQSMVREINATAIKPQEFLSDEIYYYDREMRQIQLIIMDEIS